MAEPLASVSPAPREPLTVLRVRGEAGGVLQALGRQLRLDWPLEANALAGDDPAILWLAPGEWLIVGQGPSTSTVGSALDGVVHHLSDATEQLVGLDVTGPLAGELIAAGCSLDLHPRRFGPGRCAQSQLAGVPVLLRRLDAGAGFRLYVDSSLAPWLLDWLANAAEGLRP